MGKTFSGDLLGSGLKIGIVTSRWNDFMGSRLLDGAMDALTRHGANEADIDVAWVPGAYELPLATMKMVDTGRYDGVVALGIVIRGSTPHFDFVANEATKGIAQASWQKGVPVGFGLLTTDTLEQAIERSGSKAGNKGAEAALAVVEMVNLLKQIG